MIRRFTLAILSTGPIILGVVALSAGQPSTGSGERHVRAFDASSEVKATLAVFATPQTHGEALPEGLADELEASDEARPGENPTQARRVELPAGAVHLWPTADGVCTSWGACVPARQIQEQGVVVGDSTTGDGSSYGRLRLSGLVRDGIDSVTVTLANGRDRVMAVKENVFILELTDVEASEVPVRLTWVDDAGAHSKPTGMETPQVVAERLERAIEEAEAKAQP
jgi:hypothetical protein